MSPFQGFLDKILYTLQEYMDWDFLMVQLVKNPLSNAEDVV